MDRFSLNSVDDAIPAAMGQDAQSVVLKIPESVRSTGHHLHLVVEALRGAVALVGAPHHHDWLEP